MKIITCVVSERKHNRMSSKFKMSRYIMADTLVEEQSANNDQVVIQEQSSNLIETEDQFVAVTIKQEPFNEENENTTDQNENENELATIASIINNDEPYADGSTANEDRLENDNNNGNGNGNGNGKSNDEEDDDEDDDDDDDDVKITIGEIKATTPPYSGGTYAPINFNIAKRGPAFGPGGQVTTNSSTKNKNAGLNIDGAGTYNDTPIYELNLDTLEDKPWRKPGADITDYFNYGFTEETWKLYCERQKKIQCVLAGGPSNSGTNNNNVTERGPNRIITNGNQSAIATPHTTPGPKSSGATPQASSESPIPVASVNENSKYSGMGLTKKAGPPPCRKTSGTIDVIGGGTPNTPSVITSRRPPDTPDNNFNPMMTQPPPGPGIPPGPFHYPPPPFGIPPPHAGMDFLPPHPIGPRGINPSVMGNVQPSTSYPPPHMVDYGIVMVKRERDDDERERREKEDREREERDKRDREERERRDKRRERDERDKRDRREREKHVKKERRDDRDRDREKEKEKDEREKRERRDRDKSERRHRSDREEREERHDSKKRKKSDSESRDKEEREKREKREKENEKH